MTKAPAYDTSTLIERASAVVPVLRRHATWTEDNRRLHEESLSALADAGVFRLRTPVRYGGYECDASTLLSIGTILGQGDGSTAWNAGVWWITTWMAGLFSDTAQDEVFATPNVRVCGTLSPSGTAIPVDGGLALSGKWGFISGARHSDWQVAVAIAPSPGGEPAPIMALVPLSDLEIIDDWDVSGLSGTGSVTTVAKEVFVPIERVLPMGPALQEQYLTGLNGNSPIYRMPMLPTAAVSSVGTALGLGLAARDEFFRRLPDRKITYTGYTSQAEAPVTHLHVADASLKLDEAEFHARRLATTLDHKAAEGEGWTLEDRVRARMDMARACQLSREAVDIYGAASGASSLYRSVVIQRIERDLRAISRHALMHRDTNLELYGRVLCGLAPNTFYL